MAEGACFNHSTKPAMFRCDGCDSLLCEECIQESHALLLCKLCGERAMPIHEGAPATARERKQQVRVQEVAGYTFMNALFYPFRGSGLFLFLAALVTLALVTVAATFNILPCAGFILYLAWLGLLVGIQFKIVRSTAEGENTLPDWPEFFDIWERLGEILAWIVVVLLNYAVVVAYLFFAGGAKLLSGSHPGAAFWIGCAACLWLGTALAVMALGAAGTYFRYQVLRIDLHIRGLFAAGAEGMKATNLVFLMAGLVGAVGGVIGDQNPFLQAALSGTVGLYWAFTFPHISGLLFRRKSAALEQVYYPGVSRI